MTASINTCLTQLQSDLETALVSTYANKVYGYRTLFDKLPISVSLSHLATVPLESVTGGKGWAYDMVAYMVVQHTGTAATLAAAETSINDLENAILDALDDSRNSYWMKVDFPRPSTKPGAPPEEPGVRYGAVYFRLLLK